MKFTNLDKQLEDWTYYINYRKGIKFERKRGQKLSQINGMVLVKKNLNLISVMLYLLIQIESASTFFTAKVFNVAKRGSVDNLSPQMKSKLEHYLSHILEQQFSITGIAKVNDKDVFNYTNFLSTLALIRLRVRMF